MYDLTKFESDLNAMKPRAFDTYILPAFLIWYAIQSKGMKLRARRMLFVTGVYMGYRSYSEYKKVALALKNIALETLPGGTNVVSN